ncbi:MAG: carboxypeptidase regulatory-like domain-containing protein [Sandaracinaceae bacterium]|nr:carboxypeptidase regulatory-like domain-containing protein [Sandaracinaceae bacterium]
MLRRLCFAALLLTACDPAAPEPDAGEDAATPTCELTDFEVGDADGHADPLGVGAGEARAGRVRADQLPDFPSGLQVWEEGDFVLANEHVAMVIEDAGQSELYDPWGGRPVGVARVEGGALVEPADFGEILILAGRMTVLTQRVTVLADGSDGGAAIVRAQGPMRALPFFESITAPLLPADFSAFDAAIDYVLEPGARHVDVFLELRSRTAATERSTFTLHGFMHTPRMPPFAPGVGFDAASEDVPWLGFADSAEGTSFAYLQPGRGLSAGLEVSGFFSVFTRGIVAQACAENRSHHARIVIGGPGVDGVSRVVWDAEDVAWSEVSGVVRDASGATVAGAWVLASDADGFVSRARTAEDGAYAIAIPDDVTAEVFAFREGDTPTEARPATGAGVDLAFAEGGWVHVTATGVDGSPLPARIQLFPGSGTVRRPGPSFGLPEPRSGRLAIVYPEDGEATLRAPAGTVRVIASRGYEYELVEREITVAEGETVDVAVTLERVIDTTDVQCGDFHIHTHRSNDSGDDAMDKLRAAIADGLELPVRSDHEYPGSFASQIAALGVEAWAYPVASIEMTSFQLWGHMGVVPLDADPTQTNAGAPAWQTYPTMADPDAPIVTREPPQVFDMVRALPGAPVVIINHPRGSTNYFGYAGYDPVTGTVANPEAWDEDFGLVEVFNSRDWRSQLDGTVADWLSFLRDGRRVFAVGSSDSHELSRSPMGYPRTCLRLGTDTPSELSVAGVRDALAGGRSTISGGVYVDAWVGEARPGDEATGLGERTDVRVRVQAASWIDVDAFDVVVDGAIVETIAIRPEDADPLVPTVRFDGTVSVPVGETHGFVLVAAYGDGLLDPVHPGRVPFGVTNPIFLSR